ncbi:hypothetical protein VTO73DRAFT_6194 [Trametes versicolor]
MRPRRSERPWSNLRYPSGMYPSTLNIIISLPGFLIQRSCFSPPPRSRSSHPGIPSADINVPLPAPSSPSTVNTSIVWWTYANTTSVHPRSNSLQPTPAPEPSHRLSLGRTLKWCDLHALGVRGPGDGDDGGKTLVKGARWLEQRMLVWYPVSVPLLPDVDESDSRFAKLRISISTRKFSVDNGIHWYISSDTSDDLAVLRICAPTDVRVVHQQEKVCRTRPGSSKKRTALRDVLHTRHSSSALPDL